MLAHEWTDERDVTIIIGRNEIYFDYGILLEAASSLLRFSISYRDNSSSSVRVISLIKRSLHYGSLHKIFGEEHRTFYNKVQKLLG